MTSWGDFQTREEYQYDEISGELVDGTLYAACAFCDREYYATLRPGAIALVNRGDMSRFCQQQRWLALDVLEHCMADHAGECFGEPEMGWRRAALSQLEDELFADWLSLPPSGGQAAER